MKHENGGWLTNDLNNYTYINIRKPAYFVYDDCYNEFYANDLEGITNMFYEEIIKTYQAWKEICAKKR